jgi:hypothetical protein
VDVSGDLRDEATEGRDVDVSGVEEADRGHAAECLIPRAAR